MEKSSVFLYFWRKQWIYEDMNKENRRFSTGNKTEKMWENFVDNVDNLVHNSFWLENQGKWMWMYFRGYCG